MNTLKNFNILIRTDGNKTIGLGHVMRCLSLAKSLKSLGHHIIFALSDPNSQDLIATYGFQSESLHGNWRDYSETVGALIDLGVKHQIQGIITDSYFADSTYYNQLYPHFYSIRLDDLEDSSLKTHCVINYNLFATQTVYESAYQEHEILTGIQYVPMRNAFMNLPKKQVAKVPQHILIMAGGADPEKVTADLLAALESDCFFSSFYIHVVLGEFSQSRNAVEKIQKYNPRIIPYINIQNIEKLMSFCDIAISAGGSTLYELSACGTPTISFSVADNQLKIVSSFQSQGLMPYGGDIRINRQEVILNMLTQAQTILAKDSIRKQQAEKLQACIDGEGANRLAYALQELLKERIS